jgi:hypothetical protein
LPTHTQTQTLKPVEDQRKIIGERREAIDIDRNLGTLNLPTGVEIKPHSAKLKGPGKLEDPARKLRFRTGMKPKAKSD